MAGPAESALVRGLGHLQRAQEAIAQNLANATSTAYKRRAVAAEGETPFAAELRGALPELRTRSTLEVDTGSGALQPTGDRLHLAIDGDAWFGLRTDGDRVVLTRRGELSVDADGLLRTANGDALLGRDGQPISVAGARDWTVSPDGTIRGDFDGVDTLIGQVGLYHVAEPQRLSPLSAGRFEAPADLVVEPATTADAAIRQGYVEQSNVDAMLELVRMIGVQRGHEAQSRALGTLHRLHTSFATQFDR